VQGAKSEIPERKENEEDPVNSRGKTGNAVKKKGQFWKIRRKERK
jgi:hypothetical protein